MAKTVADWRNELRLGFNLPPEKVPDLPKLWTTFVARINGFVYLIIST